MWFLLIVLLAGVCQAEYRVRCSNSSKSSVSVVPVDAVAGRYVVEYCTAADSRVTKWVLIMNTVPSQPQQNCSYKLLGERYAGVSHSHSVEDIDPLNFNCTHVCFSKPMDLMFRSCYRILNQLFRNQITSRPNNTYYFADNNITEYSRDLTQFVTDIDYDTTVSFHWFEGHIPITDYEIIVWPNTTHYEDALVVTNNCSREAASVHCILALPLGCYALQLRHVAPWTKGFGHLAVYEAHFCHSEGAGGGVRAAGGGAAWWAGGAALLLGGGALAALAACHVRRDAKGRLRVWRAWRDRQKEIEEKLETSAESAAGGKVLVLYARESPAAAGLAAALLRLLAHAAPGQVLDVHSPALTAAAAARPGGWLRGAVCSPAVRVLLLQTPALAALRAAAGDHASSPLLGGAQYRRPVFADSLLQYALQLLAETAHAQAALPYKKYFLATVSAVPVEVFPCVVPYTRFELPGAGAALVNALWPGAPPPAPPLLAELAAAAEQLARHVRDTPHYLADLLVCPRG